MSEHVVFPHLRRITVAVTVLIQSQVELETKLDLS